MSNVILMSGKVLVDRLTDSGASTGLLDPAEVATLTIEETTELKTLKSKGRDTYGQVIASVSLKQPAKVKLSLKEVDPTALAVALLGETSTLAVTAGTIASGDPTEVTLIPDRWVELPHRNITPHVAVTSPIVITKVSGSTDVPLTDVEINTRMGLIKYIGTTFTAATPCTMTYKYGATDGTRISGSTKPTVKMKIIMDGKNLVTGDSIYVTIDEATLTPSTPIDFAAEDWSTLELEGELTTLTGKTSPYTVDIIPA